MKAPLPARPAPTLNCANVRALNAAPAPPVSASLSPPAPPSLPRRTVASAGEPLATALETSEDISHAAEGGDAAPEPSEDGSCCDDSEEEGVACPSPVFPALRLVATGPRGQTRVEALPDTGARSSFIAEAAVRRLGLKRRRLRVPRQVTVAIGVGKERQSNVDIAHYVVLPLETADSNISLGRNLLFVTPLAVAQDIIFGRDLLAKHQLDPIFSTSPPQLRQEQADGSIVDLLAAQPAPAGPPPPPKELHRLVLARIEELQEQVLYEAAHAAESEAIQGLAERLRGEFADLFPTDLPQVGVSLATTTVRHRIELVDPAANRIPRQRAYPCPRKYLQSWRRLLDQHLRAGRLRPSSSPYASPSFIIPKADPQADPRWVNDYRRLNANTVKDRTPLPLCDDILTHAGAHKYYCKIDMTNAFFQTPMADEDIAKTAVSTPWGLFEWVVMPMGLCNAPATHQRRVNEALGSLIGETCYVYLDDLVVWSDDLEAHERRVRAVLEALRAAGLYCSTKKTDLVTESCGFLGHVLSRDGVAVDPKKVDRIRAWPVPRTIKQLRGFLGLVQYLRKFIPVLAEHTARLTPLTKKGTSLSLDGKWTDEALFHFEAIKDVVTELTTLKPIDHSDGALPIWLMTDASNVGLGGVLLQGEEWRTARPVGWHSRQFIAAERHYPTHEQELLAILDCIRAWRVELLGVAFTVLTDHDTLKSFHTQKDLSKRQARWLETFAEYDMRIEYLPGPQNLIADALSRYSFKKAKLQEHLAVISEVRADKELKRKLQDVCDKDSFYVKARENVASVPGWREDATSRLLYFEDRLVIPDDKTLRNQLLHEAHDTRGHFGKFKTHAALTRDVFWPGMRKDVNDYVRSCDTCQRVKSSARGQGLRHALAVPPRFGSDIALDFVGPLPKEGGFDMLLTITDRLTGYTRLIPCRQTDGPKEVARLVFEDWTRLFGLAERMVSDRDRSFTTRFWRELHARLGTKLQLSTSFHPQTDGRSERTNKTALQVLRGWVDASQSGWRDKLGLTEYAINAAVNEATGTAPFEAVLGFMPRVSPRFPGVEDVPDVDSLLDARESTLRAVRDELAAAKMRSAAQVNTRVLEEDTFAVGDLVKVDTKDRRAKYKLATDSEGKKAAKSAKLFDRFEGPYEVTRAWPEQSIYRLKLDASDRSHPTFHISKLARYHPNDPERFPDREPARPGPIDVDGGPEYVVDEILEEGRRRGKTIYHVKWVGWPETTWEPAEELEETEALERWLARAGGGEGLVQGRVSAADGAAAPKGRRGRSGGQRT